MAGVFGFPCGFGNPVVYGFGAHSQRDRSIEKATRECVQRLGFLWGETLPQSEPQFMANAEYHQDFYLQPRMQLRLRAWLSGEHVTMRCKIRIAAQGCLGRWYVDLTPVGLKQRIFVAKALPTTELELTFGHGHPDVEPPLPEQLRVHPVA